VQNVRTFHHIRVWRIPAVAIADLFFGKEENRNIMADVELQQVGPYGITRLLSVSSTSSSYQGKLRKKDVTIKRLNIPLTAQEAKEAFMTRGKYLKKLKHRHIINVQDVGFDSDYGYLVMDYIAGETLRQRFVPEKQLAPDEVKRLLSPLAEALNYAHINNILHNNLHPGNLLMGAQNDTLLAEFSLTVPGVTPSLDDDAFAVPYMAPEHLQGQPTAASDQYALAVMVYEWLCGRRPYEATERDLLLQQQQQIPLAKPGSMNTALSPAVERVIMQALAFNPGERFPNVQAFADNYLSALMGFPVRVTTTTIGARSTAPISASLPAASAPIARRNANDGDADAMKRTPTLSPPGTQNGATPVGARFIVPDPAPQPRSLRWRTAP